MTTLYERKYNSNDCTHGLQVMYDYPNGIHNDGSYTVCIDNTNLGQPLQKHEQSKPIKKDNHGRKYRLVALSQDNESTWRYAVIFNDHPEAVIYSYCHYDGDKNLVIHDEIHKVNILELYQRPMVVVNEKTMNITINKFDVYYIDRITSQSDSTADNLVECSHTTIQTYHRRRRFEGCWRKYPGALTILK